jgi:peptidoglycan-N-acetylglucosamine deacetylase
LPEPFGLDTQLELEVTEVKPTGALSLDLDNHWSHLKMRGDERWREYPTYLPSLGPLILDELDRAGMRATVFVIGRDASDERNQPALAAIAGRGHDVGNHSYAHEPGMADRSIGEVRADISAAEEAIARATGLRTRGFRGPGFVLSEPLVRVLAERGYRYDSSTLATFAGPLARWWYLRKSSLSEEERNAQSRRFGTWQDGLRPNRPHWLTGGSEPLLEMPVTVFPGLRLPFHTRSIIELASYSVAAAMGYFELALSACQGTRTFPTLVLHPLDFVGADELDAPDLLAEITMPGARKRTILRRILALYGRHFQVAALDDAVTDVIAGSPYVAEPRYRLDAAQA